MKAIEFKSKISNNKILIPKKVQSELRIADDINVRVMVFFDDLDVSDEIDSLDANSSENEVLLSTGEIDSINQGLKDFEEGRTHSHETARKLYEKYL
jgi:predicted transcriptional regulator